MLLATLVVFCCASLPSDAPKSSGNPANAILHHAEGTTSVEPGIHSLPEVPVAKAESTSKGDSADSTDVDLILPKSEPFASAPIKPAGRGSYETARERKIWYGLVAAGHSAAIFDAYSTRNAVSGGYGVEGDPLIRPFAHSNAIYAATQVSPAILDYVGHKMMTSDHGWMRRLWWVPQVAGTSLSLSAGIHNSRLVP